MTTSYTQRGWTSGTEISHIDKSSYSRKEWMACCQGTTQTWKMISWSVTMMIWINKERDSTFFRCFSKIRIFCCSVQGNIIEFPAWVDESHSNLIRWKKNLKRELFCILQCVSQEIYAMHRHLIQRYLFLYNWQGSEITISLPCQFVLLHRNKYSSTYYFKFGCDTN